MQPTIKTLPARTVVGLGAKFISVLSSEHNNHVVIPRLWEEFGRRMAEITRRTNGDAMGCVFCRNGVGEGGAKECYYLAGVEVAAGAAVPAGMELHEIPEGTYAVFIHRGKIDTIGDTMNSIYNSWLPSSGHQLREAPDLEIYGEKFDPCSDDSELEIGLPVA